MKTTLLDDLKPVFTKEKVFCRIVAAWCASAAMTLLSENGFFELSYAQSTGFGTLLATIALFFVIFSAIAVMLPKIHTDSWILLLAASLCVFKWLKEFAGRKNDFLFLLAVLLAYCIFLLYFLKVNDLILSKWQPSERVMMIFTAVCGVASCAVIATITCLRYETYSSPNFDFGLFCNMFHYMKETGLPFATSERNGLLSHFAVHISPIYYLLLPFYYIFPSPLTLQIGQAVVLASGIIPVYLIAKHYKLSGKMTMLVTMIYALYPALSAGCFYDIHENCFLTPLLLWLFYFFEKEKTIPMYIFAAAVLMVKEDAMVYIVFFAIYAIVSRKKYLHGTILALASLVYFGFATYMLSTWGDGVMVNRFDNLIFNKDDGLVGAVKTALVNPGFFLSQLFTTKGDTWEKIIYFLQLFLPLGLIPFCTKKFSRWLLLIPTLVNLVTYYVYQYNIGFQYSFGITAFVVYAMIQNIPELHAPTRKTLISIGAAACACMYIMTVLPKLDTYTSRYTSGKATYDRMDEILDTIPEDASLNVSTMLLAHVADREVVYEVAYHGYVADTDYVVLDDRYNIKDEEIAKYEAIGYEVEEHHDGLIIIMKKAS